MVTSSEKECSAVGGAVSCLDEAAVNCAVSVCVTMCAFVCVSVCTVGCMAVCCDVRRDVVCVSVAKES